MSDYRLRTRDDSSALEFAVPVLGVVCTEVRTTRALVSAETARPCLRVVETL